MKTHNNKRLRFGVSPFFRGKVSFGVNAKKNSHILPMKLDEICSCPVTLHNHNYSTRRNNCSTTTTTPTTTTNNHNDHLVAVLVFQHTATGGRGVWHPPSISCIAGRPWKHMALPIFVRTHHHHHHNHPSLPLPPFSLPSPLTTSPTTSGPQVVVQWLF